MRRFAKQHTSLLLGIVSALALAAVVVFATPVFADTFGLQPVDQALPLGNQDIRVTIGKIIRAALGLLGVLALGIILYGGYVYMTAGGNEENVARAKQIMINGVIGLAIILSAMAITQFVISKLAEATGSGGGNTGCQGTWEECNGDDDFAGSCTEKFFVSKSITPSQDNTNMNNIVIRAVFSHSVATAPGEILRIERGSENITNKFSFAFVPGTQKKVLEATYTIDNNCAAENKTDNQKCLEVNETAYKVTLREDVISESGDIVNKDEDCEGFDPVKQVDFKVNAQFNDIVAPAIGAITYVTENGETSQSGVKLLAGTTYPVKSLISDDKGVGYVHLRVEKEGGSILLNTYNGPSKNNSGKPYQFEHNIVVPANAASLTKYKLTIHAFDIDHNVTQATSFFFIMPQHCANGEFDKDKGETDVDSGGPCGCGEGENCQCSEDVPCANGLACVAGACISQPEIVEISPQDGSSGNWISIIGSGFGKEKGTIEFGKDTDNDGIFEDSDEWIEANVVQCKVVDSSWTNNFAVVEVPASGLITSESAEFSNANASKITTPLDYTNNNSWTIAGWYNVPNADGQRMALIGGNNGGRFEIYVDKGRPGCRVWDTGEKSIFTDETYVGGWHHVACVQVYGGNPRTDLYVDGALKKSVAAASVAAGGTWSIGFPGSTGAKGFTGLIDETVIFTKELDKDEIKQLATKGSSQNAYENSVKSLNPTLYYSFEGTSGATVNDESGNKNNGGAQSVILGKDGLFGKITTGIDKFSSIRVTRKIDGKSDKSTDDFGIKPMPKNAALLNEFKQNNYPAGVFVKKDNVKRPGLCAVVNNSNKPEGLPGISVVADGVGFGPTQGNSFLSFGGLASSIDNWADTAIKASVPGNVNPGKVAVHVDVNNEQSNKVLFTILGEDNENTQPIVTEVSPSSTTKGSFVTIIGKNFGNATGLVHLAPSQTTKCPGTEGCKLLSFELPATCGDTWNNTQIIGKIPNDVNLATYHIIVERAAGLQSKPSHSIQVVDGPVQPGICKLQPSAGPAPLPPTYTKGLELFGTNFSTDPTIYFWKNGAQVNNLSTWLSSKKDGFLPGQGVKKKEQELIETFIPVNDGDGQSMQTGLIKVQAASGALSNGIKYEVNDCREEEPLDGYRCCTEGPGAGQWVKDTYTCPGEVVTSGYVWRFTTGIIPNLPRVIEQCDIDNWDKPNAGSSMPSPVPSILWPTGDAACVNANIEVALTTGLDKTSLIGPDNLANTADDRIKVYTCGEAAQPVCDYSKSQSLLTPLDIADYDESEVLTIWNAKQKKLNPNTWYRVVLSKSIQSVPLDAGAGATEVKPLQPTKPLADLPDSAYYFDFKTSSGMCVLQQAFIVPPDKTTHILGLLKNPWNQTQPFYYHIKGKANQACILVPVDGKGWQWSTGDATKAKATVAPLKNNNGTFIFEDSRATAEALAHAPEGVPIKAKISNAGNQFKASFTQILSQQEVQNGVKIGIVADIKKIPAGEIGPFDFSKPFSFEYKIKMNDDWFPSNRTLAYREGQFAIEIKPDARICFVVPPETGALDGQTQVSACGKAPQPFVKGMTYHYVWVWNGKELSVYDKSGLMNSTKISSIPEGKGILYVGGKPGFFPVEHQLFNFGILPNVKLQEAHIISHLNGGQNIDVFADESMLYIDLFDPEVIYFEPNCSESCINADIRVDFNRQMAKETYAEGFRVFKCADGPTCGTLEPIGLYTIDQNNSTDISLRATIQGATKLAPNTWYKVSLNGNNAGVNLTGKIKSLGQIDPPKYGKPLPKTEWLFRTKDDATPCSVNRLEISPNPFTLYFVGHKVVYSVSPYSTPNACSKNGQLLNKWDYGYNWSVADQNVAKISDFNSSFGWQSYCSAQCLKVGSDIARNEKGEALTPALCGNGVLDIGEDCEITDTVNGNANPDKNVCTLNCLYTPDKAKQLGLTGSDPLPTGNLGAGGEDGKSYCNDGIIGAGEACDIGKSAQGCTSKCLHTGTTLAKYWCEESANTEQKKSSQCAQAVSVCGNGKVEINEECEVGKSIDGVSMTADTCDNSCLLKNLCNVNIAYSCNPDEDWCNDDCTPAGSSVLYKNPTLCGNGKIEAGEEAQCEITDPAKKKYEGQSAVQIATAVGKAQTDAQGVQKTKVNSKLQTNASIVGSADLSLQCGFVEFKEPKMEPAGADPEDQKPVFNNCVGNTDNDLGVAVNSCCMPRPQRASEYPVANAGFDADSEPVCRNSYIEVVFDKEMLLSSLAVDTPTIGAINTSTPVTTTEAINEKIKSGIDANVMLVIGYKENYVCLQNGGVDVTAEVQQLLGTANGQAQSPGFWQNLWNKIKTFFVRLVDIVFAAGEFEAKSMQEAKVWCAAQIPLEAQITYDATKDNTTSTISLLIQKLLKPNTVHGVFIRGGIGGVRDVSGVGIKSPDYQNRNDAWFFKTGDKVCKINSLSADPNVHLFTTPNTQKDFQAFAETANGQFITSIPSVYAWTWNWKPENPVFTIPDVDDDINTISSKNVEGHINGILQATITADLEAENNQLGKKFTTPIDLTAAFCENPWPSFKGNSWTPWKSDVYNFSFSYCADAGAAGNTSDDLPYLNQTPLNIGLGCAETGDACSTSAQCPEKIVFAKAGGEAVHYFYNYEKEKDGVCAIKLNGGSYIIHGAQNDDQYEPIMCSIDSDCLNGPKAQWIKQDANQNGATKTINDIFCSKTLSFPPEQLQCQTNTGKNEEGVLQKQIFLNDKNTDALGFQIFLNEDNLSIDTWYIEQFETLGSMKKVTVAGNEALTDGVNYYVSGFNFVPSSGKIYRNVYLFSVNPDAALATKNVLEKILGSLSFNTNMTDHGLCLESDVAQGAEGVRTSPDLVTDISCSTDFDCRDAEGQPKDGTNGTCSNAKTKLFRDIVRLDDIEAAQAKLDAYFDTTQGLPSFKADFKAGSFIPGYTNSHWSVSWSELGGLINGAPLDPVNQWTTCGITDSTDQQTCWNAVDAVFHCPNVSQVYEYEFNKDGSYVFHAPLEFFKVSDELADEKIDFTKYSALPWCEGKGAGFSPSDEQCGNGIVGPNEFCDPPGKVVISTQGVNPLPEGQDGECKFPWSGTKECTVNADCPYMTFTADKEYNVTNLNDGIDWQGKEMGICAKWEPNQKYYALVDKLNDGSVEAFICSNSQQCATPQIYGGPESTMYSLSNMNNALSAGDVKADGTYRCLTIKKTNANPKVKTAQCEGAQPVGPTIECKSNEVASNLCNATCTGLDYASCKPISQCNNGIVEIGEACDDGALNGTYGHCAIDCQGLSASYCGDGKFDAEKEYCDWSHPNWNHGPVFAGQSKYYNADKAKSCAWDCQAPGTYCGDGIVHASEGEACDDGNSDNNDVCNNQCQYTVEWCKQAVLGVVLDDDPDEEKTNAQGKVITTTTEIMVGYNGEVLEECATFSQKQICEAFKVQCIHVLSHIQDNAYTKASCVPPLDIKPIGEYAPDEFQEMKIVCEGAAPEGSVTQKSTNPLTKDQCGNGIIETYKDKNGKDLIEVCDKGDQNGKDCVPSYGQSCTFCSQDCKTILTKDAIGYCGNGKIDVKGFDANGVAQYEACDVGTLVGADIVSSTPSGEAPLSCPAFTGAGSRGSVNCTESCTLVDKSQCVACNIGFGKPVPKVVLLNPLVAHGSTWPQTIANEDYLALYRMDINSPFLGFTKLNFEGSPLIYKQPELINYLFVDSQYKPITNKGIDTNALCKDDYKIHFNYRKIVQFREPELGHGWLGDNYIKTDIANKNLLKYGDLFSYPVSGQTKEIVNEYIMSPAVPPNHFRIVLTWTKEEADKGHQFGGIVYNPAQGGNEFTQQQSYFQSLGSQGICANMKSIFGWTPDGLGQYYWYPASGSLKKYGELGVKDQNAACLKYYGNVFVHAVASTFNTFAQSFTIDTDEYTYDAQSKQYTWDGVVTNQGPFAFMVQSLNDSPIAQLTNSNVKVDIYTYHDGQVGTYSVYKPTHTFYLKDAAGTSSNQFASYWHVFNLEFKNGVYTMVPIESLETNFCQVKDNVPGAPQCAL